MAISQIGTNGIANGAVVSADIATGAVALATQVSGTLPVANGGTGLTAGGPTFSAYVPANFAIANSTDTKVPYSVEDWDTASCYDTTNYRFTPTVAGYYQVNAALFINPPAGATSGYILLLYKNGGEYKLLDRDQFEIYFNQLASGSAIVYLNGTTDYIEIFIFQNSGGSLNFGYNGSAQNYFQASLARTA
jgi:hypothetical protein